MQVCLPSPSSSRPSHTWECSEVSFWLSGHHVVFRMALKMLLTCPLIAGALLSPQICLCSSVPILLSGFACSCALWTSWMLQVTSLKYLAHQPSQLKFLAMLLPVAAASSPPSWASSMSHRGICRAAPVALTAPAMLLFLSWICHHPLLFPISTTLLILSSPLCCTSLTLHSLRS